MGNGSAGPRAAEAHWNQARRAGPVGRLPERSPRAFHRRLAGYAPTPLLRSAALARELGVGELWLKHERERFGLPAFKILGGSWAVLRLLERELGQPLDGLDLPALRERAARLGPRTLVTATDGNHGRGVARVARLLGLRSSVLVPRGTVPARIEGIASEGARVRVVDGSYDRAVEEAAREARAPDAFLVQDTSLPGYEEVPRWVIEGYATLFEELDLDLAAAGEPPPDLALVGVGVGALLAAALAHATHGAWPATRVVGVEPLSAACALAALRAGRVVTVEGPHDSMMAGLNCGTLAPIAWPAVRDGLAAAVAIGDGWCEEALWLLAREGVETGESGAAPLAALLALLRAPACAEVREALGVGSATRVLCLLTEGVTDPERWRRVVGRAPRGAPGAREGRDG